MPRIAGVILVGGKARRLNGVDKSKLRVGNKSCLDWVSDVLTDHVDVVALSVAKNTPAESDRFATIQDWPSEVERPSVAFAILSSLTWGEENGYDAIITTPVDTPFLPHDFVSRMRARYKNEVARVCSSGGNLQGLHALWSVGCLEKLKHLILNDGVFRISDLHDLLNSKVINFPASEQDAFLNVNTPEALKIANERFRAKYRVQE